MTDHDELELGVARLLLGAADPAEEAGLRAHIESCASCQELSRRLGRVVSALPLAVEEVRPPDRLRERILAQAAAGRGSVAAAPPVRRPRALPPAAPGRRPWLGGLFRVAPAYAAAAVAVAFAAGLLLGRVSGPPAPPAEVARHSLAGSGTLAGAQASVVELRQDGVTLVGFRGLPQPAPDRVYEIWLITPAGRPDPAGVFRPEPDGSKVVVLTHDLRGYAQLAVTQEKGPAGVPAPTSQPELAGSVA